jgi:flagellin
MNSSAQNSVQLSIHAGWETAKANEIEIPVKNFASGGSIHPGNITILTQQSALNAVSVIDQRLSVLNSTRAKWGAIQNRFEHTISNLQNVNENIKASRSQIQDADFARESANLARTQVLQQAGMGMLSQANQQAQNVMQLLK